MEPHPKVAEAVSLLSEPSRAAILSGLMDERFHTATELAYMAGIKQQTASFHLSKLMKVDFITMEKHGRHRYYRLARREVAEIFESLMAISQPPEIRSLTQSSKLKALRAARTCYDHLAGELGVKLTGAMVEAGYLLASDLSMTPKGARFFDAFGVDLEPLRRKRRSFSRPCLDWSERQHHLAGALGQGLAERLFELGWLEKVSSSRAVTITDNGRSGLEKTFGLKL